MITLLLFFSSRITINTTTRARPLLDTQQLSTIHNGHNPHKPKQALSQLLHNTQFIKIEFNKIITHSTTSTTLLPMLFAFLIAISFIALIIYAIIPKSTPSSICVMVLGDLGRSPRMQYHTLSLAENYPNHTIELIGIKGSPPHPLILSNPRINVRYFKPYQTPTVINSLPGPPIVKRLINLACKVIWQLADITQLLLFDIEHPQVILVQTPPAIPLLGMVRLLSYLLRCTFVIDWHNFGYTLLSLPTAPITTTRHNS